MSKLTPEQNQDILTLINPYLPNATIDDVDYQDTCGCYSEWTTESTHFSITFKASQDYSEKEIQSKIRVLENIIRDWAQNNFAWFGCECCCDEDNLDELGYCSVRIIPYNIK